MHFGIHMCIKTLLVCLDKGSLKGKGEKGNGGFILQCLDTTWEKDERESSHADMIWSENLSSCSPLLLPLAPLRFPP